MRIGIHGKLALSSALLVLVMTALTGVLLSWLTRQAMGEQKATDLAEETRLKGQDLLAALTVVQTDTLSLASRREVLGLFGETGEDAARVRQQLSAELDELCQRWFGRRQPTHGYQSFVVLDRQRQPQYRYPADQTDAVPEELWRDLAGLFRDEAGKEPAGHPRPLVAFSAVACREGEPPVLEMWAAAPVRRTGRERQGGNAGVALIRFDLTPVLKPLDRSPRHLIFLSDEAGRIVFHPDPTQRPVPGRFRTLADDPVLGRSAAVLTDPARAPAAPGGPPAEPQLVRLDAVAGLTVRTEPQYFLAFDNLSDDDVRRLTEGDFFENELVARHPGVIFDRPEPTVRLLQMRSRGPDRATLDAAAQAVRDRLPPVAMPSERGPRVESEPVACVDWTLGGVSVLLPAGLARDGAPLPPHRLDLIQGVSPQQIHQTLDRAFRHAGRTAVWVLVLLSGVAALLALVVAHIITRQLNRLIWATDKAARGEPINFTWQVTSRDELGVLARSFQLMLTEQRKRELAIKENEARLSTILDNANEGILTLDERGNIHTINRAAEALFGYLQSEVRGQSYRLLVQGRSKQGLTDLFVPTIGGPLAAGPGSLSQESSMSLEHVAGYTKVVTGLRKNGTVFPAEISVREVPFGDRPIFIAIVRDIAERLRTEEELERRVRERTAELEHANEQLEGARNLALEAVRTKDAFLANMSHELRTPLNAIIGYCEYLQEDPDAFDKDEALRDLAKIEKAGKHLLTIINDILDLAKIESGKVKLELTDFPVEPLLRELQEMMDTLVRNRGNVLTLQVAPELGSMKADRVRVRQVLLNLLSNANKFTDRGSILLKAAREVTPTGDKVVLRVTDTGKGMRAEEVKRLFQPFYQADSSSTRKHEGTGLGLAITKRFCNMMGGDIEVASRPGEGSTFTVRLPAQVEQPSGTGSAYLTRGPAAVARATADDTVLVIDDDPAVRELMERFLGKEGYTVRTAASGEEGLKLVKQLRPRAVTLDAMMPGIDGWAVLAAVKSDPETADIPIIMATIVDDQTRGFTLGATDYLTKPIDWGRLASVVRALGADRAAGPVLVVEDDAASRELVRKMLEKEGWAVVGAENGRVGLEAARRRRPALVLLDLMMPEVDGFQFVETLRRDRGLRDLPIVVLTARDLTEEDRQRLNGEVLRVLQKNRFTPEQLLEEIRRLMPQKVAPQ